MNPRIEQSDMIHQVYKKKVQITHDNTQKFMVEKSVKVLRKEFGFSPEMISEFLANLEWELKR